MDVPGIKGIPFAGGMNFTMAIAVFIVVIPAIMTENLKNMVPALFIGSGAYFASLGHAALDYVSFILLLGSLFVISGGIRLEGDLEATPGVNCAFLGAGALLAKCPNATLLAHPRTAKHMIDPSKLVAGAKEVYGEARFAELYGTIEPIAKERVRGLADGETFELGGATLRVHHTAGHAWHHFIVDDPAIRSVYTGDAFGLVYPALQRGVRFAIPSTSPTGFDAAEAHKSVDLVASLGEVAACLTHFDEVRDIAEVASQLHWWIDRSQEWVDTAKKEGAPTDVAQKSIETKIREAMKAHAAKVGLALVEDDWKVLALDVELNAQGLAYVATKA